MAKFILSLVLLIGFSSASAQDQWLVTAKLDTIRGKIFLSYGGPYQADDAVVKIGKEKTTYKSYEVRFVSLGEKDTYEGIKIDNRYQFAKLDVKSKYFTQYLYVDPAAGNGNNYSLRLLVNWKGEMFKVGNLVPKKKFAEFFEDCASVSDKIESGELKRKNLKGIFEAFEECMDKVQLAAKPSTPVEKTPPQGMSQFINDLKTAGLYSEDLASMIQDISQKLANGQAVPKYLERAVLEELSDQEALKNKFSALIQ